MLYTLEEFAGPLEVLIKLVHSKEISLEGLPIRRLCEQLAIHIEENNHKITAGHSAQHLLTLAQLAYEKLNLLKPQESTELLENEDTGLLDWLEQIHLYTRMKLMSGLLVERSQTSFRRHARGKPAQIQRLRPLSWEELCSEMERLMKRSKRRLDTKFSPSVETGPTLQESIDWMMQEMRGGKRLELRLLFDSEALPRCICHFLAILELFKMHKIEVVAQMDASQSQEKLWIQRL